MLDLENIPIPKVRNRARMSFPAQDGGLRKRGCLCCCRSRDERRLGRVLRGWYLPRKFKFTLRSFRDGRI